MGVKKLSQSALTWTERFVVIRSNKIFEMVVISIIIFSAMMIGVSTYDVDPGWTTVLSYLDIGVTLFFVIELSIRILAEEKRLNFFKRGWNIFDFIIVVASLIPISESEMVLLARLLRIFRVLRLASIVPELSILIEALLKAMPKMGYVVLLMFIIFYIYGAVGSFLFEGINPVLWGDISISMLTLFRVATFEDWTDVMYETMEIHPLSWIFYLSFIFLTAFVFLNMMVGVVLEVMQSEHAKYNLEHGEGEEAEVHWLKEHALVTEDRLKRMEHLLTQISQQK